MNRRGGEELDAVLDATEAHLAREQLRGWDPYDALCSPLFGAPVLRSNRTLRFGAQQVLKRLPFNVRPLLRVPKQLNPVSVGLYVQGLGYRALAHPETAEHRTEEARGWVERLGALVSPGWSGACWGYPFDWESRYASIAAGTPTIVATGMVTNALAEASRVFELPTAAELIVSATRFVRDDLHRTPGPDGSFCWSYSPHDQQAVLNATLKGSRLFAQAIELGAAGELADPARRSAAFAEAHQDERGAWPYAVGDARRWADNFHTGYVLECLAEYTRLLPDERAEAAMRRGWDYYRRSFFTTELVPKYYDDQIYPVDATACAQAIMTLAIFGDGDAAERAAAEATALLARPDGSFAYQRRRRGTVRIPYLRWSTAWMYCALARLRAMR